MNRSSFSPDFHFFLDISVPNDLQNIHLETYEVQFQHPEDTMRESQNIIKITALWRGKKLTVEINNNAALKELGHELQKLSNVKGDTMRLIVPQFSSKSSKLMYPFSDEHSSLTLSEVHISEGKPITMMGLSEYEVDEVLQVAKADLRIAGFDEEEKRLRQRRMDRPHASLKLPQGNYIFSDFRTLQIQGLELHPPPSEALKRMHMLAADPGIVAIMNKRVGIMTEMAPVGYVGISPKCILGFNKNHGEEISLRLRTDDLKGFRKYESIKKTLLHELAHMVFSEHDANFYALDSQLNREAANLDWTRSKGHTLSGVRHSEHDEEEFYLGDSSNYSQKLGGNVSDQLASARASSVAAAYNRFASASTTAVHGSEAREEPDPDASEVSVHNEPNHLNSAGEHILSIQSLKKDQCMDDGEPDPDPDDCSCKQKMFELQAEADDLPMINVKIPDTKTSEGPDPDVSKLSAAAEPDNNNSQAMDVSDSRMDEPDPDELEAMTNKLSCGDTSPDDHDSMITESGENQDHLCKGYSEPDPDASNTTRVVQAELNPDASLMRPVGTLGLQSYEPDPDDRELQRIQDPVSILCNRLQMAIQMLRSETDPMEVTRVLQILLKIIRNVTEHPSETKFKKLRKANPAFQRNVANYKAALEILFVIGFYEDVERDEVGKAETYLVLKRNDPGLLWLAKSSIEACMVQ